MNFKQCHRGWQYPLDYLSFLHIFTQKHSPLKIVEIGTRYGDTAITMAKSIPNVTINTYDYIKYEYIEPNIKLNKLENTINFQQKDYSKWLEDPEDFDLLYIDIDNNKRKIDQFRQSPFIQKALTQDKIIIFEAARFESTDPSIIFKSKTAPYKLGRL